MAATVLDWLVAASFCLLGLAMWRRPGGVRALLMLATGLAWLLGDLGDALVFAHRGPLIHLLVGHPRNRLRDRVERGVVAFGYVGALIFPLGRLNGVTLALAGATIGVVARGHHRARGPERRARLTSLAASGAVVLPLAIGAALRLAGHPRDNTVLVIYDLSLVATATALYADQKWGRWNRSALTSLVLDLGDAERPASLRDKLAAALGDPSLQLGYPAPDLTRLVDDAGRPLELPSPTPERMATVVRDDDREIAVLVHDRTVLDDQELLESVTALAKIALANVRLQADVVAASNRVDAARRRLLAVADIERRQLQAELRSGAQARLARVESLLADDLNQQGLCERVQSCREALNEFANGVHPHALTERGLSVALAELAAGSPVPVALDVRTGPCREEVDVAVYYLCAEALTNVVKYANATGVEIRVRQDGTALHVEIADDGVGGAKAGSGSGLIGLVDRLDVLGGTLTILSQPGYGTTLRAVIPLISR